jgi:TolB-like protein
MILALALAVMSQAPAPAPAVVSPPPAKQRVLVLDLRNDGAKPEHARLVTDNIVVALSRFSQLEVVSSEDVRRMVQTEGEKQAMGCTDDSCLTEIASAMGASLVVHGSIGKLESITVVNLSLYDSKAGKSIGRESIQVQRLDDLPYRVEDSTARLVRPLLGASPAQNPSNRSSASAPNDASAPAPDASSGINRVVAGGVAGGAACCLAVPLLGAVALTGPCGCFTLCTLGPMAAAVAGGAGALIGGKISGAQWSSLIVPAAVGAGTGLLTGAIGSAVVAFSVPVPSGGATPFTLLPAMLITGVPVGIVTGAAAGIATALLAQAPAAEPTEPTATAERALEKRTVSRYAMAY